MCSYRFGRLEAAGIVDGRGIGQPDDRADAGCGHQQPNAAILAVGLDRHCLERVPDVPGLEGAGSAVEGPGATWCGRGCSGLRQPRPDLADAGVVLTALKTA